MDEVDIFDEDSVVYAISRSILWPDDLLYSTLNGKNIHGKKINTKKIEKKKLPRVLQPCEADLPEDRSQGTWYLT